jgi:hypothetical protein
MIDKSKLTEEDFILLEEILKRHPEWLEYTENHPNLNTTFEISIPCPTSGNPSIYIDNFGDGVNIYFGPTSYDFYCFPQYLGMSWGDWKNADPSLYAEALDIVIEEIISEELIAACWKRFLGQCDFIDIEKYKDLLERGKIKTSVSWLGTHNHNYSSYEDDH